MNVSLFIKGDSLLLRFVLRWMVVSSLREIVHSFGFYSDGWLSLHYGRYFIVDVCTLMDGSLFIKGESSFLRFLLRWMVVSLLWEIARC